MRVLGLIPARGGSRGVPRKNVRLLAGKPLLRYTTEAALSARLLTRVVLSTDDEEIAEVGRRCGVDVPFLRPSELAHDEAAMLPVVQHAIRTLETAEEPFDAVCLLQPTNPMRTSAHIDACIELLETSGADSVVTVLPVPAEYNPHWVYFRAPDGALELSTGEQQPITRRQALPPAYHREGAVYVTRHHVVMRENSLYGRRTVGYEMDAEYSVNIDDLRDWARAEELVCRSGCVAREMA